MTIVEIIKQHALALSPNTDERPNDRRFKFLFGSKPILNLATDETEAPLVALVDKIQSRAVNSSSGYKRHSYTLEILLLDKSELDSDHELEQQPIVARMRQSTDELVERLASDKKNIDEIKKDYTVDDIYNLFDGNFSGTLLTITIIPFNAASICID